MREEAIKLLHAAGAKLDEAEAKLESDELDAADKLVTAAGRLMTDASAARVTAADKLRAAVALRRRIIARDFKKLEAEARTRARKSFWRRVFAKLGFVRIRAVVVEEAQR